ncbi:MAG: universal stress protein [Spirochaetes bacterium]|nr:universal stress protein [Spirochaetota bacterium]
MSKEMKILVALEFVENPQEILKRALSVASKYQARIYTLHVIEELPRQAFYYDAYKIWEEFRDKAVKETIEKMSSYIKKLDSKFNDIEPMIEVGQTCDKILEVADKLDVDLIILGHHVQKGVIRHLMHDHVCEKVVRLSKRPVLTFNIEPE